MDLQYKIDFNRPHLTGKEIQYISEAVSYGKISGNGVFTARCHEFFRSQFGFQKCLLTTSCTDALEMAALLLNLKPNDEVIVPSYTFVSSANPFVLRGATIRFADSEALSPNIDAAKIEELITSRTKAIVVVHYGGVACDMDRILSIAQGYGLAVVEDAAHSVDAWYKSKPLGSLGTFGTISFHETKNVIAGEGGLLLVNDPQYVERAEVLWEKGTNRAAFFRGEIDRYNWIDLGSSFLPSEIVAAFLYAQLEGIESIQKRRTTIWRYYHDRFAPLAAAGLVRCPYLPEYATVNGHLYYLVCKDLSQRNALISHLKSKRIHAIFHYLPLHSSPYFLGKHDGRDLPEAERYADCLVRLPLHLELTDEDIETVALAVTEFFENDYG